MDFLREDQSENEMESSKSSLAINGNSLCFDPLFVQSLCKILPINLIKTVRYEIHITDYINNIVSFVTSNIMSCQLIKMSYLED